MVARARPPRAHRSPFLPSLPPCPGFLPGQSWSAASRRARSPELKSDSLGTSPVAPPGDPADRFYLPSSRGGYRPNSRTAEKAGGLPRPPSHPARRLSLFLPDTPGAADSKDPAQQLVELRLQQRVWNRSTQNTNTSPWHVLRNATVGWLRNQNRPNGEARRESNWPSSVGGAARVTLPLPVSVVGVCCCVNYSSSRSRRREQPLWNDFKWNVPLEGKQLPSSPAGEGFPPGSPLAAAAARLPFWGARSVRRAPLVRPSTPRLLRAARKPGLTAPRAGAPYARAGRGRPSADLLAFPGAWGRAHFSVFLVFSRVPGNSGRGSGARETDHLFHLWMPRTKVVQKESGR